MAPRSAALLPPTGSSTVRKTITSKYQQMYDYFHLELLKRKFAMADETRVQVLNEEWCRAKTWSFMWLFRTGEDGLPAIILYCYSPTRSSVMQRSFWKATTNIWKRMSIRATTISRGSDAVPVGRISAHTPPALFPKESSMTTASRAGSPVLQRVIRD